MGVRKAEEGKEGRSTENGGREFAMGKEIMGGKHGDRTER